MSNVPKRKKCTNATSSLGTNTDIRVLLSGLQALCLYEDYCEIEVLKAPNHEFRIYVDEFCRSDGSLSVRRCFADVAGTYLALATPPTDSRPPGAPQPETEHHSPLSASESPVNISDPSGSPLPRGWGREICKYQNEPFDRDTLEREAFQEPSDGTPVGSDDPRDFRWLVDLDGPHFYSGRGVQFKREFVSTNFYINKGVFYTAALSSQAFDRVTVRRQGVPYATCPVGDRHHLGRIALVIGANIQTEPGGAALEIWNGPPAHFTCEQENNKRHYTESADRVKELFRFDTDKYFYKVALANFHPPFSDNASDGSDFIEYGNALIRDTNGLDLYHVYDLQPTSRAVSTLAPCAVVGGGGGGLGGTGGG